MQNYAICGSLMVQSWQRLTKSLNWIKLKIKEQSWINVKLKESWNLRKSKSEIVYDAIFNLSQYIVMMMWNDKLLKAYAIV